MEKKIKYLIIEDEEKSRETLLRKIEMCGIENIICTGMASNANEAIMLAKLNPPDFLLLDINLPGRNGFELIEELNQLNIFPQVIFTSAHTESGILLGALKKSPINYLVKPIDLDELEDTLISLCKKSIPEGNSKLQRIKLQGSMGPIFTHINEIVLIKSDGHYCNLFLENGENTRLFQNISSIEKIAELSNYPFLKADRCNIINIERIEGIYNKSKECVLRRRNDTIIIKISKEGLKKVIEELDEYSNPTVRQ